MNANYVRLNGEVLIDLRNDTATEQDVTAGKTFHKNDGTPAVGTSTGGGGGGGTEVPRNEVNFYDCDGTIVASYTIEEAQSLTSLPFPPAHDGLTFLDWNYPIEQINAFTRPMDVDAGYTTDDGKTKIHISLSEGRTSVRVCLAPYGTVTVDMGDGTTPYKVQMGGANGSLQVTPVHNYASAGDYVITMSGPTHSISGSSSQSTLVIQTTPTSSTFNYAYRNTIKKIELAGNASLSNGGLAECHTIKSILMRGGAVPQKAFYACYSLENVIIPSGCTTIYDYAFYSCRALQRLSLPHGITAIGNYAFSYCYSLNRLTIPDTVTSIGNFVFQNCYSLINIKIPAGVTSIPSNLFNYCYGLKTCDFTDHTAVPTLASTDAFNGTPTDLNIRVPAALYDEWIAATNWSSLASKIVAV